MNPMSRRGMLGALGVVAALTLVGTVFGLDGRKRAQAASEPLRGELVRTVVRPTESIFRVGQVAEDERGRLEFRPPQASEVVSYIAEQFQGRLAAPGECHTALERGQGFLQWQLPALEFLDQGLELGQGLLEIQVVRRGGGARRGLVLLGGGHRWLRSKAVPYRRPLGRINPLKSREVDTLTGAAYSSDTVLDSV